MNARILPLRQRTAIYIIPATTCMRHLVPLGSRAVERLQAAGVDPAEIRRLAAPVPCVLVPDHPGAHTSVTGLRWVSGPGGARVIQSCNSRKGGRV